MDITILPSGPGTSAGLHYATTFLVNNSMAVDAGTLGFYATPADQDRIRHILITHSHADHIGSLPMFLENSCRDRKETIVIYGGTDTLQALETHVFNGRIWPDYFRFDSRERPRFRFELVEAENAFGINGARVTPVPVHHIVPTFGFIVEHSGTTVVFGADSGPTSRIWECVRDSAGTAAVFLEVAFPNELTDIALRVGHLTPRLLLQEIDKIPPTAAIIATHLQPRFFQTISKELLALGNPRITVGVPGTRYSYSA